MEKLLRSFASPFSVGNGPQKLRAFFLDGTGLPILAAALLLGAWEMAVRVFAIPSFILPSPLAILEAGFSQPFGFWAEHVAATLKVVLMGLGLSGFAGLLLAIGMTASRRADRMLMPVLIVIQSTPIVALAPILIVSLGAGDAARTAITFLIAFFPIVIGLVTGMRSTPSELVELSQSLYAPRHRRLLQLELPFALPHAFAALKVAVTLAVIGAVVAEFVAADAGLGFAIKLATSYFKMPQAFFALFLLVVISLALFALVAFIQRRFFDWTIKG